MGSKRSGWYRQAPRGDELVIEIRISKAKIWHSTGVDAWISSREYKRKLDLDPFTLCFK